MLRHRGVAVETIDVFSCCREVVPEYGVSAQRRRASEHRDHLAWYQRPVRHVGDVSDTANLR